MKIHMVAGTGRSGTTWLANIINFANDYRVIFEPFNPRKVPEMKSFGYRQYLRPDNIDLVFLRPAVDALLGHIESSWVNKLRTSHSPFDRNLIKDIRANHLLKWLDTRFEIKIVLLLRHPCAVACSKLKLNWETHLDEFLNQEDLVEDFLTPFVSEICGAKTEFEKHIFLWCIENYVPLKQFKEDEIHLVFYENLCTQPKLELEKLFPYLGRASSNRALKVAKVPSPTCRPGSSVLHGRDLVGEYKRHLTKEQISRAIEILGIFGLDKIYGKEPLPLQKGDYKWLNLLS